MIQTFQDLEVYQLSRKMEVEIFHLTRRFPVEEKYALTDQIRRSSRSVKANLAEGWGKRRYVDVFKRHLIDSLGSKDETLSWLESALDCAYISESEYQILRDSYDAIGSKIYQLWKNWK
jgi:four helix bundle protein